MAATQTRKQRLKEKKCRGSTGDPRQREENTAGIAADRILFSSVSFTQE